MPVGTSCVVLLEISQMCMPPCVQEDGGTVWLVFVGWLNESGQGEICISGRVLSLVLSRDQTLKTPSAVLESKSTFVC